MAAASADPRGGAMIRAMPWVFVLIWSTGFIVARYGMPHAPPMSFLAWRYALSVLAFGIWIGLARPAWPVGRAQWGHLAVTGALMHAGYLGGVWSAVKLGMGAGTIALIVGLQPVLTAVWLSAQGGQERIGLRQWAGLALGLAGLSMVVWHKLGQGEVHPSNLALALLALLCITAATLYQKRFVAPCDVRTANLIQLLAALLLTLPLALLEREAVQWVGPLWAALAWSVLGLTLGGSSLLYLVPPCTALLAAALFGESLRLGTLVGMALTVAGVALVVRAGASKAGSAQP
jgi:drug/metabolite transporter (DMT)-like permease